MGRLGDGNIMEPRGALRTALYTRSMGTKREKPDKLQLVVLCGWVHCCIYGE